MGIINAVNINKYFGTNVILNNISFEISNKDKIGLVGVNGAGKTTLFKILTGEIECDGGDVFKSKDLKIGYMEQYSIIGGKISLERELEGCFYDLISLEKRLDEINHKLLDKSNQTKENLLLQARLNDEFIQKGGLYYKSRISATLKGLGFSQEEFERSIDTLSGGQRSKLSLAKLLLSGADVLLLDEPTNHLDIDSIEWLEGFLNDFDGAFVVISHDRYFLDSVTKKTFEIENHILNIQEGNYSVYLEKKMDLDEAINKKYNDTMKEIGRIEKIVEQQRQWNREKNIKTAESKLKQIEKIKKDLIIPKKQTPKLDFLFKTIKSSGNDVLDIKDMSFGFENKPILKEVSFNIVKGERVFLFGANGSGKSTIFKIIMQMLEKSQGELKIGANVNIGYYDQASQTLDFEKTIYDDVYDTFPKMTQTEIRNALAVFLFKGDDVFLNISCLSGGERAKVAILKVMLSGANLLLLDEPTNHLDISSKEALENALLNYEGTIFIISHDRYFINKLSDKIIYLKDGQVTEYLGNYDDFSERRKQRDDTDEIKKQENIKDNAKIYKEKKLKAANIKTLQNKINKSEEEIEDTDLKIKQTEELLNTEDICNNYEKTIELFANLTKLKETQQKNYKNWETLLAEYEELINQGETGNEV